MTKADIIDLLLLRAPDVAQSDAHDVVAVILEQMSASLERGESIQLRGFGTFSVRTHRARPARNPRTGEKVAVPARRAVRFKAGLVMRQRVMDAKPRKAVRRHRARD